MSDNLTPATAVVMAGGQSRRLGRDKALIPFEGEPLLARVVRRLHEVCGEVIVVGPPERAAVVPGVRVAPDIYAGAGPLAGIHVSLKTASHDRCLVVACDMPFLNVDLMRHLLALAPEYDVVLPRYGGYTHQLHAVYAKTCLPYIEAQLNRGDYKIDRFFPQVRVRYVDEPELRRYDPLLISFFNVNTPESLAEAQAILQTGGRG